MMQALPITIATGLLVGAMLLILHALNQRRLGGLPHKADSSVPLRNLFDGLDGKLHVDHSNESVQRTPLSRRGHPALYRRYLRYPLAYEHVAEMMVERGLGLDPSCIWRWVQVYGPEINERCRPHLEPTNKSYRVDENT